MTTAADPKIEREVGKQVRVSSAESPSDKNVDRRETEVCPATSSSSSLSAPGAGDEGEDRALSSLGTPGEPSASEDGSGGALEFEVFISFRWQDTANGFSWQLREALKHRDIRAFLMDADAEMLKTGKMMETSSKAMNRADVFIPIFSRGYAESTSCLEEIAKMVECKKLMLPVFYDVEPRDVRNQRGPFEAAFKRYEKDEGLDKKKLKAWRDALKETGEFKGYDMQNEADGELPDIFGGLKKLKVLNLCNPHLKVLPSSMFHLQSLERLYDVDCNWLEGTDMIDFSDLCSLTLLSIRGDNVYMLPSSLNSFPKLQVLTLNYCKNLKFIPTLPHSLTRLSASECPSLEKISNVSHLNALRSISLRDCTKLVDIPGLEKLRHLEELHLGGCSSLTHVVRDRIKVANFEHLLKMGISGTPTSSGGQISFVIPKVLNISRVQISIVGSFDCDQKLTGHIEIVKEGCLIFETRREAVYQYFCAFRFGEEDDMVRQIGSGNGYRIVRVSLDDGLITGGDIFVGTL
ncbi:TMV resistance protein [Nymphaea thermarum]|nr:TMV resistance protein [Nymphaea thermarum]